ncbi:MAG: POTRA domain-containing protein [Candidatus Acidiferrales bacterium]
MSRCWISAAAVIIALGVGEPARCQSPSPGAFRLTDLKFTGLNRYTDAQVSAAIGLHEGDSINPAQLAAEANKLSASGAFDHVSYRYTTQGDELSAVFQVTETKNVLPCLFDNFVWFSDEELDKTLRLHVPFYTGTAPETGETVQQISAALRLLLQSNGITATVEELPYSEHMGGPIIGLQFSAEGVPIPIHSVSFPGASVISEQELVAASSFMMEKDFAYSFVSQFAAGALIPMYQDRGYLRAKFGRPQVKLMIDSANGPPANGPVNVAVRLPVDEGSQYFWQKATWQGNRLLSAEDLDRLLAMKPQEVANAKKIDDGFTAVRKAYGKQGYIAVVIEPKQNLDDSARLAAYDVSIVEGTQYHMGQIHFEGLPDKISNELMKKWQLQPGQVYDESYTSDFLDKVLVPKIAEARLGGRRVNVTVKPDAASATVDVSYAVQ